MIRKIKGVLVVLTVAIMQCQGSDNNSFDAAQRRYKARFFDRYHSRLEVFLRIRSDIMSHHKRQAAASKENALKLQQHSQVDQELLSVNYDELRNNIDVSHAKLLIDFEKTAKDVPSDIQYHFFKTDMLDSTAAFTDMLDLTAAFIEIDQEVDRDEQEDTDIVMVEIDRDVDAQEDIMVSAKVDDHRTRFVNFLKKSLEDVINKIRN